jgi:hypothetical protein
VGWLPAIALVVVVTQRVWFWAQGRPLWLDEQMIALNIRDHGFIDLAGRLDDGQRAPMLWLWAEKCAAIAFGVDERSLRLVPLLFGVATVGVAWWVGRR